MSLFNNPKDKVPDSPEPDGSLPVLLLDFSKRYDIQCTTPGEDRLYEDVKIVAIRTLEQQKREFRMSVLGGYLEIEANNGTRMMIPSVRIIMLYEHGSQPTYKVLRTWPKAGLE